MIHEPKLVATATSFRLSIDLFFILGILAPTLKTVGIEGNFV